MLSLSRRPLVPLIPVGAGGVIFPSVPGQDELDLNDPANLDLLEQILAEAAMQTASAARLAAAATPELAAQVLPGMGIDPDFELLELLDAEVRSRDASWCSDDAARKRERNRIAARECRERKRHLLQSLERRVDYLTHVSKQLDDSLDQTLVQNKSLESELSYVREMRDKARDEVGTMREPKKVKLEDD
jgi:hypothetical protein